MEHVFFRIHDRSDPYFSDLTLRNRLKNKKHEPLPPEVEDMVDKNHPYYNIRDFF